MVSPWLPGYINSCSEMVAATTDFGSKKIVPGEGTIASPFTHRCLSVYLGPAFDPRGIACRTLDHGQLAWSY
jgi:hypothetical protein